MRSILCLLGLLALATLTFAAQVNSFTANFQAYTVGKLSYSRADWALRLDYPDRSYTEIHKFNALFGIEANATFDQWAYQTGDTCTGCKAATINYSFPIYANDPLVYTNVGPVDVVTGCNHYVPIDPATTFVVEIWFNPSNDYICKVLLEDGAEYRFDVVAPATFTADEFLEPVGCRCQGPVQQTDIVILIDRSASIGQRDYDDARATARDFTRQFDLSPSGVNVLIAQFEEDVTVHLEFFQGVSDGNVDAAINTLSCDCHQTAVANVGQGEFKEVPSSRKDVCCGKRSSISKALRRTWDTILPSARPGSEKIVFVITDGRFNTKLDGTPCSNAKECNDEIIAVLAELTGAYPGIMVFGIGVGNTDHLKMGTMCGGHFDRYTNSSTYWQERSHPIVGTVGCPVTTTFCDPSTCCGLCQCGECLAPTDCDTTDKCNPAGLFGGRCCSTQPLVCDAPTDCSFSECDSSIGCVTKTLSCPTQNATMDLCFPYKCLNDVCYTSPSGVSGCPPFQCQTNNDCSDNNACTTDVCVGNSQNSYCTNTPVQCDDNRACTIDTCNPITGCVHTNVDVPTYCNDHVSCTTDVCDDLEGCKHISQPCDDGQDCTNDMCNTTLGMCTYKDVLCPPLADNCTVSMCITGPDCVFDSGFCSPNPIINPYRLTPGAIAGTVVGVTVGAALLAVAGFVAFRIISSSKAGETGGSAGDFAAE